MRPKDHPYITAGVCLLDSFEIAATYHSFMQRKQIISYLRPDIRYPLLQRLCPPIWRCFTNTTSIKIKHHRPSWQAVGPSGGSFTSSRDGVYASHFALFDMAGWMRPIGTNGPFHAISRYMMYSI